VESRKQKGKSKSLGGTVVICKNEWERVIQNFPKSGGEGKPVLVQPFLSARKRKTMFSQGRENFLGCSRQDYYFLSLTKKESQRIYKTLNLQEGTKELGEGKERPNKAKRGLLRGRGL